MNAQRIRVSAHKYVLMRLVDINANVNLAI